MSLQGNAAQAPLGAVISSGTAVAGLTNQSDAMITVPHANGTGFWLITHQNGSSSYNAIQFDASGPVAPVVQTTTGLISNAVNFSFNTTTNQLAVVPGDANRNIEIMTFDNATGLFAPDGDLPLTSSPAANGIADVEWNPDGTALYISTATDLLLYDLANAANPEPVPLITPVSVLPTAIAASYGIQTGPDGDLYHLYQSGGQILMGKVDFPDLATDPVTYVPNAFPGTVFNQQQFPSTLPAQTSPVTVDFTFDEACANVPVQFFPTTSQPVDSLNWIVGGAVASNEWSPLLTFDGSTPTVDVTVNAYSGGVVVGTVTKQVPVTAFTTTINLQPEVTGCPEEFKDPINEPPGFVPCEESGGGPCLVVTAQVQGSGTRQWYGPDGPIAGATGDSFKPEKPGYYWLTVSSGSCVAYAGVNVKEYRVEDPKAYVWHFGNQAGIDFNPAVQQPTPGTPIDVSGNNSMNAPEGTTTISDRNGKVVFYTDGQSLWLRDNPTPITNNLGGSPTSTQSVLAVPVPGDETLYYIFTTQEMTSGLGFELRYAVFDRKLDPNGVGALVDPTPLDPLDPPSTVLFTKSTERLLGIDNWVVVHEYGTNTFRAYQVTAEGVSAPVFSNVGSDHSLLATSTGEGYMAYGAGRIGVALSGPGGNSVEVFDFDAATGEITNPRIVNVPLPGQVYGVAFSAGGEKMYVTVLGHNEILEYYYDDATDTYIKMANSIPVPNGQPGAIQRGLGGLFVSVPGQNALGLIAEQTASTTNSTYTAQGSITFTGTTTLGLPNFTQNVGNPASGPGIEAQNACAGSTVSLTASGYDPTIDQFDWFFHDGETRLDAGPTVTKDYPAAGTYKVRVLVYNKCKPRIEPGQPGYPGGGEGFQERDIVIHPRPLVPVMLRNGEQPIICTDGQSITLFGDDPTDPLLPNIDYVWTNGTTNSTLPVTRPGSYSVTITDRTTGCSNTGTQQVTPYFTVDLGPDITLCQNAATQPLQSGLDNRATYVWSINGAVQPNGPQPNEFQVNTSTPGNYVYKVVMSDANCTLSDEVGVAINPVPVFAPSNIVDDNDCNAAVNTGSFRFTVTQPLARNLSYQVNGPAGLIDSDTDVNAVAIINNTNLQNLAGGAYTVIMEDQLSGCDASAVVTINNTAMQFTATPQPGCHPNIPVRVDITAGSGTTFDYRIVDNSNQILASGTKAAEPFVTDVPTLVTADGSYTMIVTDNTGCTNSQPVTLTQAAPYEIFIGADICAPTNQVTLNFLNTSPGTNGIPTWTVVDANTGQNGQFTFSGLSATLTPGTWNVSVTANPPTASTTPCPATATRTVTITQPINPRFSQSSACVAPVQLTALADVPVQVYEWLVRDDLNDPTAQRFGFGNPIIVSQTEDTKIFAVRATATNGCQSETPYQEVRVIPPFNVTFTAPPPPYCEGIDVTLTAAGVTIPVSVYKWSFNGGPPTQTNNIFVINDDRSGTYSVVGVIEGCESPPFSQTINFSPKPSVNLGPLKRICPEPAAPDNQQNVTLTPGQYVSYNWFLVTETGPVSLNNTTATHVADEPGIYRVEVEGNNGCKNTDDVEVLRECDPIITGPNAFRPGSGQSGNQVFQLLTYFIEDEDFQIMIFNRWGEMVYESTDRTFQWNGGYKGNAGQLVPAGTYAYVVRYRSEDFPDQGIKEKRGGVVLIQ
jgi:large repetitive protein